MKAAEPGAMQGHGAKVRTTTAVFAVAGYILLAFLTMLVIIVVVLSRDDRRPLPAEEGPAPVENTNGAPG